MSAWHDNISAAALQRITTYSAFNDPKSKNLMLQTLYEELENEVKDFKETNHGLALENVALIKRMTKAEELLKQWAQTSQSNGCNNVGLVADTTDFLNGGKL